jgi:Gp5-like OB domain-containing protein
MPEVFSETETSTSTPVPKAGADNHVPTDGSAASWKDPMKDSFIAGPEPGQEQVLIKVGNQTAKVSEGNRLEEIQKKFSFRVCDGDPDDVLQFDQNRTTTVIKSDNLTVKENQNLTVEQEQNVGVGKNQTVTVKELRKIGAKEINEYAVEKIHIKAGVELILEGPGGQIIKIDSSGITIQGVIVKVN